VRWELSLCAHDYDGAVGRVVQTARGHAIPIGRASAAGLHRHVSGPSVTFHEHG
jgi:hypothetical protein